MAGTATPGGTRKASTGTERRREMDVGRRPSGNPILGNTEPRAPMTFRSLLPFFLWTFALSWGLGITYVLFQAPVERLFGPMGYTNPVFVFMVYSPGIVGVLMVWRHFGLGGAALRCLSCSGASRPSGRPSCSASSLPSGTRRRS